MNPSFLRAFALVATATASAAASAHVTLPPGGATAGDSYAAAFRVGHACSGARSTTGITVRIPDGFSVQKAEPRPGWTLVTSPGSVSWRADSAPSALPAAERTEFVVRGTLTVEAGPALVQGAAELRRRQRRLGRGAREPPTDKPAFPAARLDVLAPGVAAVDVRDAWVRFAVKGQSGTGAFMTLAAPSGARLTGASTPVAGQAEIHEMKMEGDVMRMRAVAGGHRSAAAPAGRAQARRLPPDADRPEEAAGRGRDRAADPRVRRSRRSNRHRAAGRSGARRRGRQVATPRPRPIGTEVPSAPRPATARAR